MDDQTLHTRRRRRRATVTTATLIPPPPVDAEKDDGEMYQEEDDGDGDGDGDVFHLLAKPAGWLVRLAVLQLELFARCVISLASPFVFLFFEARAVPSRLARLSTAALRRLALALLAVLCFSAALLAAAAVAALLGVVLVRLWAEEPVVAREQLSFDYTRDHPCAAAAFGRPGIGGRAVPAGHAVTVSLVLLMPESDYNRHVGVFQVTAEAISSPGEIIATSSQPCMLRFQSFPVRLMRTALMGIPVMIGMATESQKLVVELLRYTESKMKTKTIIVRLKPRAGTSDLPQIYSAELFMNSRQPWKKEVVYRWKWIFYVWMSLYVYFMLVTLIVFCCKPRLFPGHRSIPIEEPREVTKDQRHSFAGDGDVSDEFANALAKWRVRRSKRKARPVIQPEPIESSASATDVGEVSEITEDPGEFAASESSEYVS